MIPEWLQLPALITSIGYVLSRFADVVHLAAKAWAARRDAETAKQKAEAARDQADAAAVESVVARVDELEAEVKQLRAELDEEREQRSHWEGQVHVLEQQLAGERRAREAAEEREEVLAREMTELRNEIKGGFHGIKTPMLPKPPPVPKP